MDGSKSMALTHEQSDDLCLRLLEKYTALVNSYGINADTDPELLKNEAVVVSQTQDLFKCLSSSWIKLNPETNLHH